MKDKAKPCNLTSKILLACAKDETKLLLKGLCHGSPVHFLMYCQLLVLNRYGT